MNLQVQNYCTIFQTECLDLLGGKQIGCMLAEDAPLKSTAVNQAYPLQIKKHRAMDIHRASNHLNLKNPEQGHAGQENKTTCCCCCCCCCCIAGLQRVILIVIILWPVGAIGLWG